MTAAAVHLPVIPPRSVCAGAPSPCPWTECRHRFEPVHSCDWVLPAPSCALDVADRVAQGDDPPDQRLIETKGLRKLLERAREQGLPVVDELELHEPLENTVHALLERTGGLTQREIEEKLSIGDSVAHGVLRRMEARGRATRSEGRPAVWRAAR